jgi:hypothetical protein
METIQILPERAKALFFCLDGLRYACAVCALSFERARSALRDLEKYEGQEMFVPASHALTAVADLWNVVDSAYRARILAARTPYLKRVTTEYQIFERQTRIVETLRHYVQHLDSEISKRGQVSTPVWGSISWQSAHDPRTALTLIAGTPVTSQSHYSLIWDRKENKFVRPLELVVGDTILDVVGTADSVARLDRVLKDWSLTFRFDGGGKYQYEPENVPILKMSVVSQER